MMNASWQAGCAITAGLAMRLLFKRRPREGGRPALLLDLASSGGMIAAASVAR